MALHNAYPELPEVPFERTSVSMDDVKAYIATIPYIAEVKRAVYMIFRYESANGEKGVNNNYIGMQADGNRLPDRWIQYFAGTCIKNENSTGKQRRFIAFKDWRTSVVLLADNVFRRGMYIGENVEGDYYKGTVKSVRDLAQSYTDEWVEGEVNLAPEQDLVQSFDSMYKQAAKLYV